MIIEKFSYRLAVYLVGKDETINVDYVRYALALRTLSFLIITLSLCIGAVSGAFLATAAALLFTAALRKLTGGAHMPSLEACVVVSTAVIAGAPHVQISTFFTLVFTLISCIIIIVKVSDKRRMAAALCMAASSAAMGYDAFVVILLIQSISLLPKGGDAE